MNDVKKKYGLVAMATFHYFLVLLNSPTVRRPAEGCGWQPWAVSAMGACLSTSTQDPMGSGGSLQRLASS